MDPSSEESNPSSDKKYNYPLKSGTIDSKDMKRVLSPSNILIPQKIVKDEEMNPMRKITKDHLDALNAHQKVVKRKVKEDERERRDQIGEIRYHKIVAHQREVKMKIYDIKEEQENLKKEVLMYEKSLFDGKITPETYESNMKMNRKRYVEKRDDIKELQRQIISIDLGIQDIRTLIAHHEVIRINISNIKKERENLEREVPIYTNDLRKIITTPETYVSCM